MISILLTHLSYIMSYKVSFYLVDVGLIFCSLFFLSILQVCIQYSVAFFRPQPKSWGPIELGCPSVRLSVRPSVCHRFLVRARTFERKVIETWL